MKLEMAKQLKALEKEKPQLTKMVAGQALDREILKEAANGNWQALNVADARSLPCVTVWGQKESRSVGRAAFRRNHATPSDATRVGRMMNRHYCTRCVC